MTSSETPRVRGSRPFVWLAGGIVVAVLAYTAGWFWFAGQVEARARAFLGDLRQAGVELSCEPLSVRGYPFRIGVFCGGVRYADARFGAETGAFRSAAQIYQPRRILAELDGGARLATPAGPVTLDWTALRASSRLALPIPAIVSVEARELAAQAGGDTLLSAGRAEAHLRPREGHIDVSLAFEQLELASAATAGAALPPLSGDLDATIEDGQAMLLDGGGSLRGRSAEFRRLHLRLAGGEGGVLVTGPASVDADGLVDARLQLTLSNPSELAHALGRAFPQARDEIENGLSAFGALGGSAIPIRIDRGQVRVGFLTVARIPPLD